MGGEEEGGNRDGHIGGRADGKEEGGEDRAGGEGMGGEERKQGWKHGGSGGDGE